MHRIVVTGGAGFVGSALVRRLLAAEGVGLVCVADSLRNGKREFLPSDPRVALVDVDICDAAAISRTIGDVRPDVVFHLAALHFIPDCNAHPAECLRVNVVGTQNLLDACAKSPPQRIVIASTAAVYPVYDGPCGEESLPAGPIDIYGLSKWVNEQQLELFARTREVLCAAARISNVYGPRETNPHIVPEIVDQLVGGAAELRLGNVAPKRDYVYVDDVADAFAAIAARNASRFRVYNVGTGVEYSVTELVGGLAKLAGREVTITTDPARVRAAERMHLLSDNGRLRTEIGWEPRYDLQRGLAALWASTIEAPKRGGNDRH